MPVIALGNEPLKKYCNPETGALSISSGLFAKKQAEAEGKPEETGPEILSAGFVHESQTQIIPPRKLKPEKPP